MSAASALVREDLLWDSDAPIGAVTPLRAARCPSCSRVEFPRLAMCPVCLTATVDEPLGPRAELGGFTAVLHAPPGARVDVPYTIGVAAFAENLSVMGLMVDAIPLDELELGAPLQVQVVEPFAGGRTYGFRVADERR